MGEEKGEEMEGGRGGGKVGEKEAHFHHPKQARELAVFRVG